MSVFSIASSLKIYGKNQGFMVWKLERGKQIIYILIPEQKLKWSEMWLKLLNKL